MNVKADFELKNCPLCGSDKITVMGEQYFHYGDGFANAEIECCSCGTRFILQGKSKEDIVSLWNGKE